MISLRMLVLMPPRGLEHTGGNLARRAPNRRQAAQIQVEPELTMALDAIRHDLVHVADWRRGQLYVLLRCGRNHAI